MKRISRVGIPLVLAMFAFAGCGGATGSSGQEASGPRVVATHSILGDIVGNVGGDGIEFTTLVAAGEDPHVFEPSPSDSAALSDADLVFENGLEYETWLDDMYESSGSEAERVAATDGLEPIEGGHEEHSDEHADEEHADGGDSHEEHGDEGHGKEERGNEERGDEHGDDEHSHESDEHADEASHEHGDEEHSGDEGHADEHGDEEHADEHGDHESEGNGEFDPHVWGDVGNAVSMTEAVRDALAEADAENADVYRENATEYIAELRELEASVEESVSGVPEENRKLITAHDTFGYFAEAYDFEVVGTAIEGFTTEASDPAAGDIADLSDGIRATGVPAIFPETTTNEAIMERIANEAGVELAPPLYTDALGEEGSEGDTYIAMTEYNASTIADALE